MQFRDYYKILDVPRTATAEQIRRAYRTLARKHHPDANPGDNTSDERFKEINEAYEVLKDPEKRQRYDALGANWKAGQDFRPPPGFEGFGGQRHGFNFGDFSDFFEALFGGAAAGGPRVQFRGAGRGHPFGFEQHAPPKPQPVEVALDVPIDKILQGGTLPFTLTLPDGRGISRTLKIARHTPEGRRIRLAGEGPGGEDIHLRVRYTTALGLRIEGADLVSEARITPAQAVLGCKASVESGEGALTVTIPPGSNSGRRLRLRGKGLPLQNGARGDLFVQVMIDVPAKLTAEQRRLYEELSSHDP